MNTYSAAAAVLARSADPEDRVLARAVERFAAGLTDVTTERAVLARELSVERTTDRTGVDPSHPGGLALPREKMLTKRNLIAVASQTERDKLLSSAVEIARFL